MSVIPILPSQAFPYGRSPILFTLISCASLWLVVGVSGCKIPDPPPPEPYVSERLVGDWYGEWALPGLLQFGLGELHVGVTEDHEVNWQLLMSGGLLSGPNEPPLEIMLNGLDDRQLVVLTGDADTIGHVELSIDMDGNVEGFAEPGTTDPIILSGWVRTYTVRLDFVALQILQGWAQLDRHGPTPDFVLDTGTDDTGTDTGEGTGKDTGKSTPKDTSTHTGTDTTDDTSGSDTDTDKDTSDSAMDTDSDPEDSSSPDSGDNGTGADTEED